MRKKSSLRYLFIITCFLIACLESDERKITETQVPAAIIRAFSQAYPNAVVREYNEEIEDGERVYEISFRNEDRKIDILYSKNGDVIEVEELIGVTALPSSIHEKLRDVFGNFKIIEAEKITRGTEILYEVRLTVTKDGIRYEILFSGAGQVIDREEVEDEEPEGE